MAEHNDIGKRGEEHAKAYLLSKGYQIRHTNWTCGKLELDMIAEKDGLLIIIEVKTRSTNYFGLPQEAVTPKKIRNIISAAHEYILLSGWTGETQFDIITVIPQGKSFSIEHIEDAFLSA